MSDVGVETITMRPTQEEENKKWFPLNIFTYRIGLDFFIYHYVLYDICITIVFFFQFRSFFSFKLNYCKFDLRARLLTVQFGSLT